MRHDRRIAFSRDMSHERINESDDTGLKGKTKERRSPGCSQTHGLAQAESAISTEGRRCPRETLFSHHVRLVAELGRRPSIPSPTHGRDSGKISKRPSDGTAPEMSQPTSIQMLDTAIWKELGAEEVPESEAFYLHSARSFPGGCSPARNIPKWRQSNSLQRSGPMSPNRNVSCNRALKHLYATDLK